MIQEHWLILMNWVCWQQFTRSFCRLPSHL